MFVMGSNTHRTLLPVSAVCDSNERPATLDPIESSYRFRDPDSMRYFVYVIRPHYRPRRCVIRNSEALDVRIKHYGIWSDKKPEMNLVRFV